MKKNYSPRLLRQLKCLIKKINRFHTNGDWNKLDYSTKRNLYKRLSILLNRIGNIPNRSFLKKVSATMLLAFGVTTSFSQNFQAPQSLFDAFGSNPASQPSAKYNPDMVDIDGDGDLDLFYGMNNVEVGFHENTGTSSAPAFGSATINPFSLDMSTVINSSSFGHLDVEFADIDNDGDYDLFAGGYYFNDVYYYENVGDSANPVFASGTMNPFGIVAGYGFYSYTSLSLVDLDKDGDLDIMGMEYYGNFVYYENTGTPSNPIFGAAASNPFLLGNVGGNKNPALDFTDVDNDGDMDIFVGLWQNNGDMLFFENIGTPCSPEFASATTNPFGITSLFGNQFRANPSFGDLDNDGDEDMIVGFNDDGQMGYYQFDGVPSTGSPGSDYLFIASSCMDYVFNGATLTNSGVYSNTLTSSLGCDSTVTLDLTINPVFNLTEDVNICSGADYTYPDGTVLSNVTTNTSYTSNLQTTQSCDSIIQTNLNVTTVDATITTLGATLSVAENSAGYQWVDCDNGNSAINGETNQNYTATLTGNYAVEVTQNGCMETSVCTLLDFTGVEDNEAWNVSVYPNPTNGNVFVSVDFSSNSSIKIYDVSGRIIHQDIQLVPNSVQEIELPNIVGMYFIEILNEDKVYSYKLIKQ